MTKILSKAIMKRSKVRNKFNKKKIQKIGPITNKNEIIVQML